VLVAGWAEPSREIAVHPQLPTATAGDDRPRTAGLRRAESGVFSFSLWGLSGLTESIGLKLGPDSTIPVAIEELAPVEPAHQR
jgi:hypothetical protein